jgi:DNA-binding IclR family transcriptional regulator
VWLTKAATPPVWQIWCSASTCTMTPSSASILWASARELGQDFDSLDLRSVALPVLTELTQVAGETALLSRYTNGSIVYVECIIGPAPVAATHVLALERRPFARLRAKHSCTPPSELDRICVAGLKPHTDYTITDPSVLRAELHEVRIGATRSTRASTGWMSSA